MNEPGKEESGRTQVLLIDEVGTENPPQTSADPTNAPNYALVNKQRAQEKKESVISMSLANGLTLLSLVVGAVIGIYQLYVIPVAKSELETKLEIFKQSSDKDAVASSEKQKELQEQIVQLEETRANLLQVSASPIPLYPKNDEILISNEVTFHWDFKGDQRPHYIIEIARWNGQGLTKALYNVIQPENRIFYLPITERDAGEYLWRVEPGALLENRELATGSWSAYQSFSIFTSVEQKIVETRKLTVGMYPNFTDRFNSPVPGGKYEGLSVELARYIATELTKQLPKGRSAHGGKPIEVEIRAFAWQDLLNELAHNSVDVVISSVTATRKREEDFGIYFSKGYYTTRQMLLSNGLKYDSKHDLFANLRNKRVGVIKGTTNERAALYLAQQCNCGIIVKRDYNQLNEAKHALFVRDVDLLLTDDIWLTGESNLATFVQYGPTLGSELSEFYQREYGRSQEEYSIAIPKKGGDGLLKRINSILDQAETQAFLKGQNQ